MLRDRNRLDGGVDNYTFSSALPLRHGSFNGAPSLLIESKFEN